MKQKVIIRFSEDYSRFKKGEEYPVTEENAAYFCDEAEVAKRINKEREIEATRVRDEHILEIGTGTRQFTKDDKEEAINRFGIKSENFDKYYAKRDISDQKEKLKSEFLRLISGKVNKISEATELIAKYILDNYYIYTTKDDLKSEMWIYKDGIYSPNGRSEIKEIIRSILEEWFNMYYYNQIVAKVEVDTFIEAEKFFSSNHLNEVPVQNGILNIIKKELTPFVPEKIFFNKLPVAFIPDAKCPNIDKFLEDVLSNPEDKKVIEEFGGYALLKDARFEKAFMAVGGGRNGKGKTIELIKRVIGLDNCASVPLSALTENNFQISELFSKMVNLAGDISNTDLKETGMFKSLTGRDQISAKRKFMRDIKFENYAKFLFACNELPMVYDLSKAFWDRWVLLEYPYYFAEEEEYNLAKPEERRNWKIRDEDIINKITSPEELSGLLNRFLEGLDRLLKNKRFSSTKGSAQIKDLWIKKSNSFMAFALDMIEESSDSYITKKELRKKYSNYCKLHNIVCKSDFVVKKVLQENFGAIDERITIRDNIDSDFIWVWRGVKWK